MKRRHVSRATIAFDESSDHCMTCGRVDECVCARYPGHHVPRWTGEKRNFSLSQNELLLVGMHEALKTESPPEFLVCVLSYFVTTGA